MPIPPEGIGVGDSLTQEEIEEAFNTGFGYRISGINPRRDEHDRRYILLFANEDGPYSDSVTQGQFEYIGEGLDGDQSEDSQGNSALIDAQTSDIPIHFFYKRAEEADWEYQGRVDMIDYEFQEQDGREVLAFQLEHQQHTEAREQRTSNDAVRLKQRPNTGATFAAEIDRISNSGNGIIEIKEGTQINIGPVKQDAVGIKVAAVMETGQFARCKTEDVIVDGYKAKFEALKNPADHSSFKTFTEPSSPDSLPPVNERITTEIGGSITCNQCGSLMYPNEDGNRVCSSCGYQESDGTAGKSERRTDSDAAIESTENINHKTSPDEGAPTKSTESSDRSSPEQTETASVDTSDSADTSELRKRAMQSAVEEVPEEATTVQHTTPSYNRSQAVKEYVKARADGVCEGCGEPAPFTSKTGEPYLHAHHIHELSDGGSDTPDTVVALCPNCHYRVHHGKDGDEYNEELLEIVQEKEHTGQ